MDWLVDKVHAYRGVKPCGIDQAAPADVVASSIDHDVDSCLTPYFSPEELG